jgi:hypothetical protein
LDEAWRAWFDELNVDQRRGTTRGCEHATFAPAGAPEGANRPPQPAVAAGECGTADSRLPPLLQRNRAGTAVSGRSAGRREPAAGVRHSTTMHI